MTILDENVKLVADIGGTHIRLAQSQGESVLAIEKYLCTDYPTLADAINHYLQSHSLASIDQACLAVAAAINADEVIMTNSDWRFSMSKLKQQFDLSRLAVINDFEAVALAVPNLTPQDTIQLGGGEPDQQGNIVVLGPGTGLGVKHLTPTVDGWKVLTGEGGHVDFAPVDENDIVLWHHMQEQMQPIAIEEILSGRGLVQIYNSIVSRKKVSAQFSEPEAILREGLSNTSSECAEALHQFVNILGSFAGNLALNLNTRGGVYLCGGVVTQLKEFIQKSAFRDRFDAKGRFHFYVVDIPVFLITEDEPGLLGAAAYLDSIQS